MNSRAVCFLLACVAIVSCKSNAESNWLVGEWVGVNTGEVLTIYGNGEVKGINPDNPNERVPLGKKETENQWSYFDFVFDGVYKDYPSRISFGDNSQEVLYVWDYISLRDVYHKKNRMSKNPSISSLIDKKKSTDGSLTMVFSHGDADITKLREFLEEKVMPVNNIEVTQTNLFDVFYISFIDELVEIPDLAFSSSEFINSGIPPLFSIIIPITVKRIGRNVFGGQQMLMNAEIPESVEELGDSPFSNCFSLRHLSGKYATDDGNFLIKDSVLVFCPPSARGEVVIPNDVTTIGHGAFENCKIITNVIVPPSVRRIESGAFWGCSFSSIILPNSLKVISNSVFRHCSSLRSIIIPDSVEFIGINPFEECTSLERFSGKYATDDGNFLIKDSILVACLPSLNGEVVIPGYVTTIGHSSFAFHNLSSVKIPSSVEVIESNAFGFCKSLKSVSIPSSVKEIMLGAFRGCESLSSVELYKNTFLIADDVFDDCPSLKKDNITILNTDTIESSENEDSEEGKKSYEREDVRFNRIDDVFVYLDKHTFKSEKGYTLSIRPSGISLSGTRITNAVRVSLNNEYSATITANTPVGESLRFIVNCSTGQIVDMGTGGDYFYEQ